MHTTAIVPLINSRLENFGGKQKQIFSLSGAVNKDNHFIYLGIHGSTTKIELCYDDVLALESLLKELRNAGTKPKEERVDHHQ